MASLRRPSSLEFRLAAERLGGERALRRRLSSDRRLQLSYEEISRRFYKDGIAEVTAQTINTWCQRLGIANGKPR